jgi:hypothetical protein
LHEKHCKLLVDELTTIPKKLFYDDFEGEQHSYRLGGTASPKIAVPYSNVMSILAIGFEKNIMWFPVVVMRVLLHEWLRENADNYYCKFPDYQITIDDTSRADNLPSLAEFSMPKVFAGKLDELSDEDPLCLTLANK